ncbi:MAG: cysteine--tRNA ligase, partial [Rickettsiaceae bacterium]|nr:cysteine--tRNA ligase [Rickettsiaceae bacterium]
NDNKIKMYVCGPTVYDDPHIGNGRSLVVYDLLYRLLKEVYHNYEIIYIRNITDIDDKIIDRASKENISTSELTSRVIASFNQSCKYLNCLAPTIEPKASENLDVMEFIIEKLIENKCAYISDQHVYFSVASYKEYGKLANRTLDELQIGARIKLSASKKDPEDFVLWKPAEINEVGFESKFGKGRPGWHIECSAMSYKFLGENFDIHGGGADLMFPHHSNEIAQSCSAFPGSFYARFWVHNGFVTRSGEKMSKSLGNFITILDFAKQNIDGEILRIALLSSHYRSPLDFSDKLLNDIESNVTYLYRTLRNFEEIKLVKFQDLPSEFRDPLLDDLNISPSIAYMMELASRLNKEPRKKDAEILYSCGRFLGIFNQTPTIWLQGKHHRETIEQLIQERLNAKKTKDWQLADNLRQRLLDMGIVLEDTKEGKTLWSKK